MPISVRKVNYQLQLSDKTKTDYPGSSIVQLNIQDLLNVADNLPVGQYLVVGAGPTITTTAVAPGGGLNNGVDFPGAPQNGDIFLLTRQSGQNEIGIYSRTGGAWVPLLTQAEQSDLPSGIMLPAVVSGLFFLTQNYQNNKPGVYSASGGNWVQIAGVYSDTEVRQLIVALTGRVTTLEGDNPVTTLSLAGSVLTVTKKDGTTEDLNLPAGQDQPAQPATSTIIYGFTASIEDQRVSSESARNQAGASAITAFNANNQTPANYSASGSRSSRVADNIFSGSYVPFDLPSAPDDRWWNVWLAVPAENITKFSVVSASGDAEGDDDTANWSLAGTVNVNNVLHNVYVRNLELETDDDSSFIFKVYR